MFVGTETLLVGEQYTSEKIAYFAFCGTLDTIKMSIHVDLGL